MKTTVAVFDNHELALHAIQELDKSGFPLKKVSLVGKACLVEDNIKLKDTESSKNAPLVVGAAVGPIIGLLTGIGIFAIPGFGFLFGAGAVIGIMGGLDLGILTGGIITLLATLGISEEHHVKFEEQIKTGKFLMIVEGSEREIEHAKELLLSEPKHLELV
jgi:hypothetical protein